MAVGQGAVGWSGVGGGKPNFTGRRNRNSRDLSDFGVHARCETTDLLFNQAKRGGFL